MKAVVFAAMLLALISAGFAQSVVPLPNRPGHEVRPPLVGQVLPDVVLPTVSGGTVRLASLRGRPAVVVFWAFWCDTWREVHRGMEQLERDSPTCQRVTISIDCQWTRQLQTVPRRPYEALEDPGSALTTECGVRAVPTVLLLDRGGVVRACFEGWPGNAKLLARLRAVARSSPRFAPSPAAPGAGSQPHLGTR